MKPFKAKVKRLEGNGNMIELWENRIWVLKRGSSGRSVFKFVGIGEEGIIEFESGWNLEFEYNNN